MQNTITQDDLAEIEFNFFNLNFIPLKGVGGNSSTIMKSCIEEINKEMRDEGKVIIFDRYGGRKDNAQRRLFVRSMAMKLKDDLYKCKIVLIRDGKLPQAVDNTTYNLTEIKDLDGKDLVEVTEFYLSINNENAIICCEKNSQGPTILDIEYYFRQISKNRLVNARGCKAEIHMKMSASEVLSSIKDVLKFKIKTRPDRLRFLGEKVEDAFVRNTQALAASIFPREIRIEAFFREMGSVKDLSINSTPALNFTKKLLCAVKKNNDVLDDIKEFYLEYENENGEELEFSLINARKVIVGNCSWKSQGIPDTKELYDDVKVKFKQYLKKYYG